MKREIQNHGEFTLYEIMDGRKYHSAVMPSEGDPFEVLAFEQRHNSNLTLVEVKNGNRRMVAGPAEPQEMDFEQFEWDDSDDMLDT
jgi:hypothetical protein